MIVRIMGEGQRDVPEEALDQLNALDLRAEAAVEDGDQTAFTAALLELHEAVRLLGTTVPDDVLVPSDVVLPPADIAVAEVRALFEGDGLVPG